MEWAVIITTIIEAIAKCLEDRRRDLVEEALMNPGFRERRVCMRILRDQDLHGRELRRETDEAMGLLDEMDAEDIGCLLDEAEAFADEEAKV